MNPFPHLFLEWTQSISNAQIRIGLVTFQLCCCVWGPLVMPFLVTSEYNKDYDERNVLSTSSGRNKTSSPKTVHSLGQGWGGRGQGGDEQKQHGLHGERDSEIEKIYAKLKL